MPDTDNASLILEGIVPALASVASLVVAAVSVRVAKAASRTADESLELAKRLAHDEDQRLERIEKLALVDAVLEWAGARWLNTKTVDAERQTRVVALKSKMSVALQQSSLPGAGTLQDVLWTLDRAQPDMGDIGYAYLSGSFINLTERLIAQWLRDPADEARLRRLLSEATTRAIAEAWQAQKDADNKRP